MTMFPHDSHPDIHVASRQEAIRRAVREGRSGTATGSFTGSFRARVGLALIRLGERLEGRPRPATPTLARPVHPAQGGAR